MMPAIFRHWQTTLCGIVGLVAALPTLGLSLPPTVAAIVGVAAAIAGPLGHVLAADGKSQTEKPPTQGG